MSARLPTPLKHHRRADAAPFPNTARELYVELASMIALPCPEPVLPGSVAYKMQRLVVELVSALCINAKMFEMSHTAPVTTWPSPPPLTQGAGSCEHTQAPPSEQYKNGKYTDMTDDELDTIMVATENTRRELPVQPLAHIHRLHEEFTVSCIDRVDHGQREFFTVAHFVNYLSECSRVLLSFKDALCDFNDVAGELYAENKRRKTLKRRTPAVETDAIQTTGSLCPAEEQMCKAAERLLQNKKEDADLLELTEKRKTREAAPPGGENQ
ncbi:uncharacterized protein B0I36DRAFT_347855 [Microdochium trichocladiopsis]|uniref:Uncharacterized protein n=1 Tax=Microdochium trichocladiopsis TaxID=1682393 RepID=A0A9P8Y7M6_9PEZI|nr:uncharacterized protein B0I36DRAFT_347855 [Microdochium trichocladiopsis]KAH7032674.1 hypothetical protein B0I36DRAFT_347855 [Microdochium trichocladiopsis]